MANKQTIKTARRKARAKQRKVLAQRVASEDLANLRAMAATDMYNYLVEHCTIFIDLHILAGSVNDGDDGNSFSLFRKACRDVRSFKHFVERQGLKFEVFSDLSPNYGLANPFGVSYFRSNYISKTAMEGQIMDEAITLLLSFVCEIPFYNADTKDMVLNAVVVVL